MIKDTAQLNVHAKNPFQVKWHYIFMLKNIRVNGRNIHALFVTAHLLQKLIFKRHVNTIHSQDKDEMSCDKCGKQFQRMDNLRRHNLEVHKSSASFNLEYCDKYQKPWKCNFCEECFKRKGTLDDHQREVHNNEPATVKCEKCGKTFNRMSNWRRHMQIHEKLLNRENEPNHKCEECGKTFGRRDNLKKHVNNVH